MNKIHVVPHSLAVLLLIFLNDIEITSWKAHAYGIFTRVGEKSEIERVSVANGALTSEVSDTKPTSVKIPYKAFSML